MNYLSSSPISVSTLSDDYQFFSVWSPMSVSPCLGTDWGAQKRPIIKANEEFYGQQYGMRIDTPLNAAHYFNALHFQTNYQYQEPLRRLFCRFCFENRESEAIYTSHEQYDVNGNIKCPILKVVSLSPTFKSQQPTQISKSKENLPLRSQALDTNERMELVNNIRQLNGNTSKCKKQWCIFCKNNKEPEEIYKSHVLKDSDGKTVCPILQKHVCPICSATGEQAHTITYCKEFKKNNRQKILQKAKFKISS